MASEFLLLTRLANRTNTPVFVVDVYCLAYTPCRPISRVNCALGKSNHPPILMQYASQWPVNPTSSRVLHPPAFPATLCVNMLNAERREVPLATTCGLP